MPDYEKLIRSLERRGFAARLFPTAREAADYLDASLDGVSVGFGGSRTVQELELFQRLSAHNDCFWHWDAARSGGREAAAAAQVYICSVNGLSEDGELINIDGAGNRVASTLFGHGKVIFVVGRNKLAPDYDAALWRARNIAAPLNARRLKRRTPCTQGELRCHDCKSPERICAALCVLWEKPSMAGEMEVVLVDQDLGF